MPLEADRFLYEKINKEAVDEQKENAEKLKRKIQNIYSKKEGIEPVKEMGIKDYNLFLKRANEFSKTLMRLTNMSAIDDELDTNTLAELVKDWNNIVVSLSRLKYKKLIETDKRKVKERLDEIKPVINSTNEVYKNKSLTDPTGEIFVNILSKMSRQIDEDLFDQLTIPIKDIITVPEQRRRRQRLRNVDEDEFFDAEEGPEEEEEEEEEDDGIDYRIIF